MSNMPLTLSPIQVSVDLSDLQSKLQALADAIGTKTANKVTENVQVARDALCKVGFASNFPDLCTHASSAAASAQSVQSDFKTAIEDDGIIGKAAGRIKNLAEIEFATKDDIVALRSLICCLWLIDHKWCSHRTYNEITTEKLYQACETSGMRNLPSLKEVESWMQAARTPAVTSPPPPTPTTRVRERRTTSED
jgi:hypothetical protein